MSTMTQAYMANVISHDSPVLNEYAKQRPPVVEDVGSTGSDSHYPSAWTSLPRPTIREIGRTSTGLPSSRTQSTRPTIGSIGRNNTDLSPSSSWKSSPKLELKAHGDDSTTEDLLTALRNTEIFAGQGDNEREQSSKPSANRTHRQLRKPPPPPPSDPLPIAPSSSTNPGSQVRRGKVKVSDSHSIYGVVKNVNHAEASNYQQSPASSSQHLLATSPNLAPSSASSHTTQYAGRQGHIPILPHFSEGFEGPVRIVVVGAPGCGKSSLIHKALQAGEGGWESFGGHSVLAGCLYMSISKTSSPSCQIGDMTAPGSSQQEVTLLEVDPSKINTVEALRNAAQNQAGKAHGVMLVYDASLKRSLEILPEILDTLADLKIPTVLLAAKSDLPMQTNGVNPKTGAKLGSYFGVGLIEVSVKHELGRQKMRDGFSYLVKRIIRAWEAAQTSRITATSHPSSIRTRSRGSSITSRKSIGQSLSPLSSSTTATTTQTQDPTPSGLPGAGPGHPTTRGRQPVMKKKVMGLGEDNDRQYQVDQALAFLNEAEAAHDSGSSDSEVRITAGPSLARASARHGVPTKSARSTRSPANATTSNDLSYSDTDESTNGTKANAKTLAAIKSPASTAVNSTSPYHHASDGDDDDDVVGPSGSDDGINGHRVFASALPSPDRSPDRPEPRALGENATGALSNNHERVNEGHTGDPKTDRSADFEQNAATTSNGDPASAPETTAAEGLAAYVSEDEIMSRLLECILTDDDSDFIQIFLLFYRIFTWPKKLFNLIEGQFKQSKMVDEDDQMMGRLQEMKLCQFLLIWVNDMYYDFCDREMHQRLATLLESISHESHLIHYSTELLPLTLRIPEFDPDVIWARPDPNKTNGFPVLGPFNSYASRRNSLAIPLPGSRRGSVASVGEYLSSKTSNGRPPARTITAQLLLLSDSDIALELTRIEWLLFSRITGREMFRHVILAGRGTTTAQSAAAVAAATAVGTASGDQIGAVAQSIAFFNRISSWVQTMILSEGTVTGRAKVMTKMMGIAEALRAFNNFNTLLAVLAGIKAGPIHRLRSTRQVVEGRPAQKAFTSLEKVMSSDKSFSAYRLALRTAEGPTLPYLGVHLQDLLYVYQANQDTREVDGKIHWQKIALMGEVVLGVLRCQKSPFRIPGRSSIEELIKSTKVLSEDQLYDRSFAVEPKRIDPADANPMGAGSVRRGGMGAKK